MSIQNRRLYQATHVFGLIFALVLNFMAIALPLNGNDTRTLSDKYTNLFVPAPLTFSIWSIIYLGIIAFVIRGLVALRSDDAKTLKIYDDIGVWFTVSCLCNGLWIVAWHYEVLILSVVIMFCLLFSLSKIFLAIHANRTLSPINMITILAPISLYLGWICVATIANFAAFFVGIDWNAFGIAPVLWTKIMMTIAAGIGVYVLSQKQDIPFMLVLMWAFFGIYSRHYASNNVDELAIGSYALTLLIFMALYIFLMLIGKKSYFFEKE